MAITGITGASRAASGKLVFIHVAKTAGTSVKKLFLENFPVDQVEVELENCSEWIKCNNLNRFETLRFLSGHMAYAELDRRVDLSRFLVVTVLRNPLEHIISHIAHFRRFAEKEHTGIFNNSSEEAQTLIQKLSQLDLAKPEAITYLYKSLTNYELLLFDNYQVRNFCRGLSYLPDGQRIGFQELESALKTFKKIDVVGDVEDIPAFLATVFGRMGWMPPQNIPKENANNEKYGMDIRNPAMVNALWPFIHFDCALYSQRVNFSRCCLHN